MKEILYHLGCIKHCVYIMGSTTSYVSTGAEFSHSTQPKRKSGIWRFGCKYHVGFGVRYFPIVLHRNGPGVIRTRKRVSQNVSKHKKMNNKKSSKVFFASRPKTNKINIYIITNTNHFILQPDLTSACFSFARDFQGREIFQKVTNFV